VEPLTGITNIFKAVYQRLSVAKYNLISYSNYEFLNLLSSDVLATIETEFALNIIELKSGSQKESRFSL